MLAVSTPVVGAAALGAGHTALVQPHRDIVRVVLAALDLSSEGFTALNETNDGLGLKVLLAALKRGGRSQGLNDSFRQFRFSHDCSICCPIFPADRSLTTVCWISVG